MSSTASQKQDPVTFSYQELDWDSHRAEEVDLCILSIRC
ncbi:hypothetical protein M8C21_033379 [Ambrosia artemisiifolia]|uniref:Uncharacterized protein n=1 Tax=Ambrosia artemisiifolia TaxID=4212 RepID=A0AAD5BRS8_AMBAR|nr:hypothetical protein M8C21_033379 [Ambrosia artemisiifolia]